MPLLRTGLFVKLLTPAEVVEITQISEFTVLRLCREGKLPGAKKIGGQWRIVERRLEDWLLSDNDDTLPSEPQATDNRIEGWR